MDISKEVNIVEFLSGVSFFSEVSKASLSHFSENLIVETYRKGDIVFEKGEQGQAMYVITQGEVRVFDDGHTYGFLRNAECFGEYALIDDKERSASVGAVSDLQVIKIRRTHFFDLLSNDHGFAKGILSVMIKRHRELDIIQEKLFSSKQQLEVAHSKLNNLITGAMDGIIMFDASYRIILANPSAQKMLENKDVLKRNILYFFKESDANRIEQVINSELKEVNRSHVYIREALNIIGTEGGETFVEATLSSYENSDDFYFVMILRDLRERMQAQETIHKLESKTEYLQEEIKALTNSHGIIANHDTMKLVLQQIDQVAVTNATVLITGETGTGKELVARAIHMASKRIDKPLIRVNCGAIPHNLIESELFGHEKGAFTGAVTSREGRFLLADKGSIFLDEIGELPIELQPKLLRVIQEGEFEPVGSSTTLKVDVRMIAATHRDLLEQSRKGKFREDLFYRLNVFPIKVPPLRVRGNDILMIATEMIEQFSKELNKTPIVLDNDDRQFLLQYKWPGNVRELQNLMERAVILSKQGKINLQQLITDAEIKTGTNQLHTDHKILSAKQLSQIERDNIIRALKQTRWKIAGKNGAASLIGIPPSTLTSKMKVLGIERPL